MSVALCEALTALNVALAEMETARMRESYPWKCCTEAIRQCEDALDRLDPEAECWDNV